MCQLGPTGRGVRLELPKGADLKGNSIGGSREWHCCPEPSSAGQDSLILTHMFFQKVAALDTPEGLAPDSMEILDPPLNSQLRTHGV